MNDVKEKELAFIKLICEKAEEGIRKMKICGMYLAEDVLGRDFWDNLDEKGKRKAELRLTEGIDRGVIRDIKYGHLTGDSMAYWTPPPNLNY